jgi:NAD(P)-dependent dehydrogenase (short-subunit alcohol dehydrogenase family)
LKGSVIVIGAGPGLGSSLARKFAKEDHHVFVVRRERHSEELNSLCDEIKEFGGSATAIPSDAREEEQVISLFSEVAKSGPIDCVVFNIGANVFFSIEETTSRVFRKIWEMGTFAGFLVGREAAKHMKDKGTIIFTGATASMRGGSGFAAFSSAKFGLRAVAQSLARELGPKGIHVAHTIIDGAIDHPWIKENFPDIYKLKEVDGILNPDDIAEAYYNLHLQEKTAWTHELDLRPYMEKF